ncbi:hypoxanthine phosphoribosyltransferase [Candidatus Uabimicrobium sp. HlEnr_7]|uniref:hypoxanthine phosphoribosyltransferase n=1 Tax=Candidatus Uabimicrobium helgolandensis TaxID=3095367 RepID=UPI003558FF7D
MSNIEEVLSSDELEERVQELADQISEDYKDEELTIITVLNGAFIFSADLARAIDLPMHCEFLKVSSYGDAKVSSGNVKMVLDIDSKKVEGKNILIVEDIVDTGNTVHFLNQHFTKMNPKSIKICSLLLKKDALKHDLKVDYVGFSIPTLFVIGYGLDYGGLYRDLPFLGAIVEDGENLDREALALEKGQ